jgi:hypothetical protein
MQPRIIVPLGLLVLMAMAAPAPATAQGGGGSGEQCFEGSDHPEVTSRIQWTTTDAGVVVRVTFSKNFVDNTYGANAIGWGDKGHKFNDLVGSDHVELTLKDGGNATKLQFKVDYISESDDAASGYRTLGVTGGDGKMEAGDASDVLSARTSLDENFNVDGYVLTEDSPATDDNYTPDPQYPKWDFDVWYEVTVDPSAFGSAGFGGATMDSVHASPSKSQSTEPVTPVPCEQPPCPEGQEMGDNGQCGPASCPEGQEMGDNGQCGPASCPEGQEMGDNGQCGPASCPEGQVMRDNGQCGPSPCQEGETMGDNGQCQPAPCPEGQQMGEDGTCEAPIPFFPTPLAWVLGSVAAIGGSFLVMRRRGT